MTVTLLVALGSSGILPVRAADSELSPAATRTAPDLSTLIAELDQHLVAARNIICDEETERHFRGSSGSHTDSWTATVRYVDGAEEYGGIRRNNRTYRSLADLGGPYMMGELTTVLTVTRQALVQGAGSLAGTFLNSAGEAVTVVNFHVSGRERGWLLVIGSSTWAMGFDGTALFSADSGFLREITWRASQTDLPASQGIDAVSWTTAFSPSVIGGATIVVPVKSTYRVNYNRAKRSEWTESTFLNHRRFGASTELTFATGSEEK